MRVEVCMYKNMSVRGCRCGSMYIRVHVLCVCACVCVGMGVWLACWS